jgi:hypothetical protein
VHFSWLSFQFWNRYKILENFDNHFDLIIFNKFLS